jgi:hypothetical protein
MQELPDFSEDGVAELWRAGRPLDPRADFRDDGGTPGWRTRHRMIDVHLDRRAALRAHLRKPTTILAIGAAAALAPIVIPLALFAALIIGHIFGLLLGRFLG